MAKKEAKEEGEAPPGGKGKLILIILIVVVLLAIGGGVAAYFMLGGGGEEQTEEGTEEGAEPAAEGEGDKEGKEGDKGETVAAPSPQAPIIYHEIGSMTVNMDPSGPARFLRVKIVAMTRTDEVTSAIERQLPMIKNDFLIYLGSQDFSMLNSPEGKDKLREELQEKLTGLLIKSGEPAQIDGILFTDMVMQ